MAWRLWPCCAVLLCGDGDGGGDGGRWLARGCVMRSACAWTGKEGSARTGRHGVATRCCVRRLTGGPRLAGGEWCALRCTLARKEATRMRQPGHGSMAQPCSAAYAGLQGCAS